MLELRHERLVGQVSGKVRRTRLLQHAAVAAESASPHSDAACSEGTPIHEGSAPAGSGVVAQGPGAARRLEEFQDFAVPGPLLVVGVLLHVLQYVPTAARTLELLAWRDLLRVRKGRLGCCICWHGCCLLASVSALLAACCVATICTASPCLSG